ncbi:DUF4393 domain-containing protein [Enterococcus hirae]
MDPSSFFPIISGILGGAASAGVFKGPIKTLEDWWFVNFGHTTNERAEMLRTKQNANIEAYKNQLLKEASSINPENLKEPELKILGPALEASKYYIGDESLREMFAKLIASSMDTSKNDVVHSSFVEIIKQMEPLDANILVSIHKNGGTDAIAAIRFVRKDGLSKEIVTNMYLGNPSQNKQDLISSSLSNLSRLGLLKNDYLSKYNLSEYEKFKDTDKYKEVYKLFEKIRSQDNLDRIEIFPGVTTLTPFGKNFCATCL